MSDNVDGRRATRAYVVFVVIVFAALIFPVYGVANHVFPLVLGLPFGLFWIVAVQAVAFVAVAAFYLYEQGIRRR